MFTKQKDISKNQATGFFGLGIAPKILELLGGIKFKNPTSIQQKAIPPALDGKDIVGIAQTGTGKTHAYVIPMVQRLQLNEGLCLVLAPTRELAVQIDEVVRVLAGPFGIKTACLIGGMAMRPQQEMLRRAPRIIVATPGRLIDHLQRHNVSLGKVSMLVIDEADRMLDMGFAPQVEEIMKNLPRNRQTLIFSATMASEILRMVNSYMKLPVNIEIAPSGTTAEGITQEVYVVKQESKIVLLEKLLFEHKGSVLLFARTKHGAHKLARAVKAMGHRSAEIHSDKSMSQRRDALEGFKAGRYRVLVATDIASRGIDVYSIEMVINYDLPDDVENYVHRIGRTGRAGAKGQAISFATPNQSRDIKNIEKLIKKQLPIVKHPDLPAERLQQASQSSGFKPHSSRRPFKAPFKVHHRDGGKFKKKRW